MSDDFLRRLQERDWFWAEALGLVLVLASGAALRYWLSTALPFDGTELAQLAQAQIPTRGLRTPFIMINGASLFALYVILRRSGGVSLAFAAMLLIQTSISFQELALRIRWLTLPLLLVMLVLAIARLQFPARRTPRHLSAALLLLALVLGGRAVWMGLHLPVTLTSVRADSHLDPAAVLAEIRERGGDVVTPFASLQGAAADWLQTRSLLQQESLLLHAELCGPGAVAFLRLEELPVEDDRMAVFDPAGAGLILVEPGELTDTVERVVRSASPDFFASDTELEPSRR